MILLDLLLFVAGLVLLTFGAEGVVRGGSRIAVSLRVSPLVVGLTLVAFGTSLPELVVSVTASLRGTDEIAIGNVVGSNIFNVLVIAGIGAALAPMVVKTVVVRREVPLMIAITLLFLLLSINGTLGRLEGLLLLVGLAGYTGFAYVQGRKEHAAEIEAEVLEEVGADAPDVPLWRNLVLVGGGILLLVLGGRLLVDGAVGIARDLGVSERIIALTIVSAGTSVPELATTLVAVVRKEADIAMGNVVGSNVFNILGIAGMAALVQPLTILPATLRLDMVVMVAASLALVPILARNHRISRLEGILLVAAYVAFTVAVVMGWSIPGLG